MNKEDLHLIPGFPGYHINLKGEVWSEKTNRYLTIGKHSQGYREVGLNKNKKQCYFIVARLLLTTFDRPPFPGEEARHLNDIKLDDRLENLAWGTHKQNSEDMIRNGRCAVGERCGNSKLFLLDVINILMLCGENTQTQTEIIKMYGVDQALISNIKTGKLWKHVYTIWNQEQS